jgi:nucleotide-binding universal stress UspA family protein
MESRRLLLPIDVNKCRPAVFDVVNRFARRFDVTAILLHVVTLNVTTAENRIYEELTAEAELYLERLSARYISPDVRKILRIRLGKAPAEILAEAASAPPDMILMTVDRTSLQNRSLLHRMCFSTASISRTVNAVLSRAPCNVLVLPITGELDCERVWGRPRKRALHIIEDVPTEQASHVPAR